jgi:Predicted ATPase
MAMDYMGKRYKDTQLLAEKIINIKKGNCMERITPSELCIDSNAYFPSISKWFQLMGFRKNIDQKTTVQHLRDAVEGWIRTATGTGSDTAFAVVRNHGVTSLLYGSNHDGIEASFKSNISECAIKEVREEEKTCEINGIFTGTFSSIGLTDALVSSKVNNFHVICIFIPVADSEVNKIIESDRRYLSILEEYSSFQRIYGTSSRKTEKVALPKVVMATEILKEEMEYLEENIGKGFVRAVIRYGVDSEEDYREISSVIQSCFRHDNKGFEPVRNFRLYQSMDNGLAIPYITIENPEFVGKIHTLTLQSSVSASSLCIPALLSCDGYYVKDYNVDENSLEAFPLSEKIQGDVLSIGKIIGNSGDASLPIYDMCQHVFVTGSTGNGKTTTVKRLLSELNNRGIPFTVIEAAKKEYFTLMSLIPGLQIYTPGNDGRGLIFNPLQPEDGVLIENHVSAVVRALLASTGGEHPIPEAYNGLLKQTYSKFGWEYGQMAYTDEYKPFPTFKDVYDNVDSYISAHAKYGPEVRQNLTAALSLRAETMHSGALGKLFGANFGLRAADLLETPTVIELADFSQESVTFIMNILLFKFQSYLSHLPQSDRLKRVIVVEEAHNVFKKTSEGDYGRGMNNEYFDKMFSEIRSSGTGLILSDQRPGIMSDTVIANTAVKIVHSLSEPGDRGIIGEASNMSKIQIAKLSEFSKGECVISLRGKHGLQHAVVDPLKESVICNAACHVCTNRFRCKKQAVKMMLEEMDQSLIGYHLSKIKANPYNISQLEINISDMLKALNVTASKGTKLCFLGEVISNCESIPIQEGRVICNSYYEYLKRREV